jgi:hypothetical protein
LSWIFLRIGWWRGFRLIRKIGASDIPALRTNNTP